MTRNCVNKFGSFANHRTWIFTAGRLGVEQRRDNSDLNQAGVTRSVFLWHAPTVSYSVDKWRNAKISQDLLLVLLLVRGTLLLKLHNDNK